MKDVIPSMVHSRARPRIPLLHAAHRLEVACSSEEQLSRGTKANGDKQAGTNVRHDEVHVHLHLGVI